ncbi:MAG: hypothetical protein HOP19_26365 [Acidobacteria bacterium]|nr:hypothetical protein [Acidobacteriota bacterium]
MFFVLLCACVPTRAQQKPDAPKPATEEPPKKSSLADLVQLPSLPTGPLPQALLAQTKNLSKLLPNLPNLRANWGRNLLQPNLPFANDPSSQLRSAILNKLGIRYKFYGTNDSGYDCSGFVWRVFQEAGANFQRVAARSLWSQLPEATEAEKKQFGTLVFFNDLHHVGIVRDDKTFYHSSSSKGVTVSEFSGYWEKRITGYRRAPVAMIPQLLQGIE